MARWHIGSLARGREKRTRSLEVDRGLFSVLSYYPGTPPGFCFWFCFLTVCMCTDETSVIDLLFMPFCELGLVVGCGSCLLGNRQRRQRQQQHPQPKHRLWYSTALSGKNVGTVFVYSYIFPERP